MVWFVVKAAMSGLIVAAVAEIARRNPVAAALVASLPLLSILAMLWMRAEGVAPEAVADHAEATFWYVLPSLPMFLILPALIRGGWGFPAALLAGCAVTVALYLILIRVGRAAGLPL
jgi:hypothetical protein